MKYNKAVRVLNDFITNEQGNVADVVEAIDKVIDTSKDRKKALKNAENEIDSLWIDIEDSEDDLAEAQNRDATARSFNGFYIDLLAQSQRINEGLIEELDSLKEDLDLAHKDHEDRMEAYGRYRYEATSRITTLLDERNDAKQDYAEAVKCYHVVFKERNEARAERNEARAERNDAIDRLARNWAEHWNV